MEPVFMIIGQSAAIAASLSMSKNDVVQDISYSDLEHKLLQENQFITELVETRKYRTGKETGTVEHEKE
jgi:hypothetical protein